MTFKTFSLGCKVNSYECSAIASTLLKQGYQEDKNDNPDIIIINTCSVTATADQKSRQHIRKFMKLYPSAIIVVMGCYSQGNYEFIINEIKPTILLGTSKRNKISEYIQKYLETKENIVDIDIDTRHYDYEELGVTSYSENVRAYLKIQDGCNNFCSYCLIPYRRGKMRSRNKQCILEEARYLASQGYQEIVLTGIHVGGYGQDLENCSFSSLVKELLDIPNLNSLRISSIEESEIDDELINLYATRNNLAKHLHIPCQSGCDSVLKRMNRKYNCEQFLNKLKKIRNLVPDVALSTDVIVGFPEESDEEFEHTVNFIKECGFNMLHVFPFSPREGTGAYKMKNQIPPNVKNQRAKVLLNLSKELWSTYSSRFINKEVTVLVEKYDQEKKLNIGHTTNYLKVAIPSSKDLTGQNISFLLQKDSILSE